MENYSKVLMDELRDIVGHNGNLIEVEFNTEAKAIQIRIEDKDMSYGHDCWWQHRINEGQKLDFYYMNFMKKHFQPKGNVLCCFEAYGVPTCEYDDILFSKEHGNSTINIISGMGVYYMTVSDETLEWLKSMDDKEIDGWALWVEIFEF